MIRILPDDVLLVVLEHLQCSSLLACQLTCRKFRTLIADSVSLQYTIELEACGMLDGPRDSKNFDVTERLKRLRLYDAAWRQLDWSERTALPHLIGRIPPLGFAGGVLVFHSLDVTDEATRAIHQQMPSKLRGVREQHATLPVDVGYDTLIDPSQDLLAFLKFGSAGVASSHCELLSTSTGEPHPLAATVAYPNQLKSSRILKDICNDYILEAVLVSGRWDLLVWNWKTGLVEMPPHERPNLDSNYACHFLDDTHLLVVRNGGDDTPCLRVFAFRDAKSRSNNDDKVSDPPSYYFMLPEHMKDARHLMSIMASRSLCDPLNAGFFHSDPDDRLLSITSSPLTATAGILFIDIPLRTLRTYIAAHPVGHDVIIPWDGWGPHGTRVDTHFAGGWVGGTFSSGPRRITVRKPANSDTTLVGIYDYHPRRVARALARERDGHGEDGVVVLRGEEGLNPEFGDPRTALPCIHKEIPLPEVVASVAIMDMSLGVCLSEDGMLFMEYDQAGELIANAWAFTF
ncbi:hypothetical protein BV25DRAFT_1898744 [Artomyces pyxidatus]|uniref:Uncharacterized protein n=1 Tax=Artomyces pyxidatus TaxID=48021 RepID=A0ACB8T700_9AGAM|nr:hypothetical protein BV25DRAFT_1898744 [Artomyces pyxidatus]